MFKVHQSAGAPSHDVLFTFSLILKIPDGWIQTHHTNHWLLLEVCEVLEAMVSVTRPPRWNEIPLQREHFRHKECPEMPDIVKFACCELRSP